MLRCQPKEIVFVQRRHGGGQPCHPRASCGVAGCRQARHHHGDRASGGAERVRTTGARGLATSLICRWVQWESSTRMTSAGVAAGHGAHFRDARQQRDRDRTADRGDLEALPARLASSFIPTACKRRARLPFERTAGGRPVLAQRPQDLCSQGSRRLVRATRNGAGADSATAAIRSATAGPERTTSRAPWHLRRAAEWVRANASAESERLQVLRDRLEQGILDRVSVGRQSTAAARHACRQHDEHLFRRHRRARPC